MTAASPIRRVTTRPDSVTLEWVDGDTAEFASIWLRDNRGEDRDAHSGQRLVDIVDLPANPVIRSATLQDGGLWVEWLDGTTGCFDATWLAAHDPALHAVPAQPVSRWLSGATLEANRDFAWITSEDLRVRPDRRLAWLSRVLSQGMGFVEGLPATEDAILDTVALAGRVCETNYGRTFDVKSVARPENLAYSDLGLGLHTDNPYREPVPGFQALHVLQASPDGGDSLFADGFAIADELRRTDPDAFGTLTKTPVPFFYRSKDAELRSERPLIHCTARGDVAAVHYNNRSVAPLRLALHETTSFYAAYRRFAALLREPSFQMTVGMRDGQLVLFDNQRILHGRTAFSSAAHGRHLRGCYLTRDSVFSQTALLRRELTQGADS